MWPFDVFVKEDSVSDSPETTPLMRPNSNEIARDALIRIDTKDDDISHNEINDEASLNKFFDDTLLNQVGYSLINLL